MKEITRRLRDAVKKSGIPAAEIEEKLELEGGTVARWMQGKDIPDTSTVKRLAEILGVSADSILFGVEKIGEMKAMFPNDATPSHTPVSDWRFLAGAIMLFTGVAGLLLMFMRYAGEGLELSLLLDVMGVSAYIFAAIAIIGIVVCIVSTVMSLRIPKKKNKKDDGKK